MTDDSMVERVARALNPALFWAYAYFLDLDPRVKP